MAGISLRKTMARAQDSDIGEGVALEREQNARLRAVDLESWYGNELEPFTFRTVFVPLTQDEARGVMAGYSARQAEEQGKEGVALTTAQRQSLVELREKIAAGISELGAGDAGVFAKLSSRSPKDSRYCEARAFRMVVERLSLQLKEAGGAVQPNDIVRAVMGCGIAALRLCTAEEVLDCFLTSDRVCEDDIPLALSFPHKWSQHIVLREWVDIPTEGEFRAFVFDGKLTAVSQYFVGAYFESLVQQQARVQALIRSFFDTIRPLIQVSPAEYVLDLAVDMSTERVYVIELNPFGKPDGLGTGTCLFKKNDPADLAVLFGESPFQFRVQTAPLTDISHLLREGPLRSWLLSNGVVKLWPIDAGH
ncbi:MAG: ATP-grasp domain-containing protein [archaeon]|nr:ATP-grasp domain-containing protein [archaeon]